MAVAAHDRAHGGPRLNIPPVRLIPASPAQRAANPEAPATVFLADDHDRVALATVALGLGVSFEGAIPRVTALPGQLRALAESLGERGSPIAAHLLRALDPVPAWRTRTREFPLDRPVIMGILNLTGDSFSGDGVGSDIPLALARAEALRSAGADIIDVGAESARADRPAVDEATEAALAGPAIAALVAEGHCLSIDTYKPLVARAALEAGAELVNDISGLTLGAAAAEEAARAGAGYVLNYSYSVPKQRPETPPAYTDVVAETIAWMFDRVATLRALGLPAHAIAVDPGIAFGKSHDEDIQVLRRLGEFTSLGLPLLLAHSRKNFIASVTPSSPADRDLETHTAVALAFEQGARIFRVHDPAGARRAATLAAAITTAPPGAFAPDSESWPWRAGSPTAPAGAASSQTPPPPGQRW